jgi:pyroglutamyl-peptidase
LDGALVASKPAKIVLVTGFSPFGGEATNPSWEIAKALPKTIGGYRVEAQRVPTEFGKSIAVATKAIDKLKPAIVLCLGQAGGRACMSVERVAINVDDAVIADNASRQPIDTVIEAEGAPAYFSTLPIKAMVAAMNHAEIPAMVSNSAGTFVCNHLLYGVLYHIDERQLKTRAGFMHVPFLPEQAVGRGAIASMSLQSMIEATKVAIMAAIRHKQDIRAVGGALD